MNIINDYSCPYCGGTMELRMDGYEYCDTCEYNTRDGKVDEYVY